MLDCAITYRRHLVNRLWSKDDGNDFTKRLVYYLITIVAPVRVLNLVSRSGQIYSIHPPHHLFNNFKLR